MGQQKSEQPLASASVVMGRSDALQLIEDLIEKNNEWWRNESHCKGEMRELGVPDDADATQVCMGDLYRIQKALLSAQGEQPDTIALRAWQSAFGTTQLSHAKARLEVAEERVRREEEAEGRCCPEDVGFEEWIGILTKRLTAANAASAQREQPSSEAADKLIEWCEHMADWCEQEDTPENDRQFTEQDRQNWLACADALRASPQSQGAASSEYRAGLELSAAALAMLQAWNKYERQSASVAEIAKVRQRIYAAIRAHAASVKDQDTPERGLGAIAGDLTP